MVNPVRQKKEKPVPATPEQEQTDAAWAEIERVSRTIATPDHATEPIVPEEKLKPPPTPPKPKLLVASAAKILTDHKAKNTPYTAGTLRILAKDLDDDVLRAAGFTAKDDAALFQIAQVLEAFVAGDQVKGKQNDEIIAAEHLRFVPDLLQALKEAMAQHIEKRKGKEDPVHAQAEEITRDPVTPPPRQAGGQAGGTGGDLPVYMKDDETIRFT